MPGFLRMMLIVVLTILTIPEAVWAQSAPARNGRALDESRHEGYYYPPISSRETFVSRAIPQPDVDRLARLGFVTGLTEQQLSRPYAPTFVIFTKGGQAERLIIIAMGANGFQGVYQARALLAQLTAAARASQLLRSLAVEDLFTFLDVARMLGFRDITISDGQSFSHQISLK